MHPRRSQDRLGFIFQKSADGWHGLLLPKLCANEEAVGTQLHKQLNLTARHANRRNQQATASAVTLFVLSTKRLAMGPVERLVVSFSKRLVESLPNDAPARKQRRRPQTTSAQTKICPLAPQGFHPAYGGANALRCSPDERELCVFRVKSLAFASSRQ